MPIIKSAKKRVKIANKATIRNRKTKRSLKSAIKAFQSSLTGDKKDAEKLLAIAHSEIDKAVKKGVIHKNKASRKKARLTSLSKEANVKPSKNSTKNSTKKTTPKTKAKPEAKKTSLKTDAKPLAKKSPAKKTASKK